MPRRSAADAEKTRIGILDRAVAVASTDGLEGLTLGRLAGDLSMSKAGILGHFESKETLQLAAFDQAMVTFRGDVWEPIADLAPGRERFVALIEAWISHHQRDVFPGGCFLTAATAEWDDRPGPMRDRIVATQRLWQRTLVAEAQAAGIADPEQAAFELDAAMQAHNQRRRLGTDHQAADRVRKIVERLLAGAQ